MKKINILWILIIVVTSCDCMQRASGFVYDKKTKEPLFNVAIGKKEKEDLNNSYTRRTYSDSLGYFKYSSTSGGLFRCPDLELYFSKEGYTTFKYKNKSQSEGDTIYLEKIK